MMSPNTIFVLELGPRQEHINALPQTTIMEVERSPLEDHLSLLGSPGPLP